jgi:hypothetical protein
MSGSTLSMERVVMSEEELVGEITAELSALDEETERNCGLMRMVAIVVSIS